MSNAFNFGMTADSVDARPLGVAPMDLNLMAETLQPRLVERPEPCPPIRVPRSARRTYSHAELCAAADMLARLQRRAEAYPALDPCDASRALDVAVDRLLDVL
jgi:hypothetical protein